METLSVIALILLSLVGYSGGAAFVSSNTSEPKPNIFDLILIFFVWMGSVYSRQTFDINRWVLILICAASAFLIAGMAAFLKRRLYFGATAESQEPADQLLESLSLWERWKRFSKKMGSFQSRSILSLFYFIIVFPFAMIVKIFSDPLRLKYQGGKSHWQTKEILDSTEDNFRKQF